MSFNIYYILIFTGLFITNTNAKDIMFCDNEILARIVRQLKENPRFVLQKSKDGDALDSYELETLFDNGRVSFDNTDPKRESSPHILALSKMLAERVEKEVKDFGRIKPFEVLMAPSRLGNGNVIVPSADRQSLYIVFIYKFNRGSGNQLHEEEFEIGMSVNINELNKKAKKLIRNSAGV